MDLCDPDEVHEMVRRFYFDVAQDDLWAGPKAEQAKALARKVAAVHSQQIVGEAIVYDAEPIERAS